MKYITGIYALNIPCSLGTPGDWHRSALRWDNVKLRESDTSVFYDYGIEVNKDCRPMLNGTYNVANHVRAILDLISDGNFAVAQGARNDFICNDMISAELMEQLRSHKIYFTDEQWDRINAFMQKEYKLEWV